jgi:hypothetical protein
MAHIATANQFCDNSFIDGNAKRQVGLASPMSLHACQAEICEAKSFSNRHVRFPRHGGQGYGSPRLENNALLSFSFVLFVLIHFSTGF